jgi:hypothetical protein
VALQTLIRNLRSRGCELDADDDVATPAAAAMPSTPKMKPSTPKTKPSTPKTGKATGSGAKTPRSRKKKPESDSDYECTPSKKPRVTRAQSVQVKSEAVDELEAARAVETVGAMDESAFTDAA